ncbi:MAG: dihydroorotate dehydrogenase electron transfer subunit [Candidatus Omnitrophica bacterium]|nr:dihydroorotate dehydrogenase electron transfer subunit [Candidatus Omnitrophota bacterium]
MPIVDNKVLIKNNTKMNAEYYLLEFDEPTIASSVIPGQFVNINVNAPGCLLRRPFSVFDVKGDTVQILYKAVGKGTTYLMTLPKGSEIDVLGPLGSGYAMPRSDEHVVLLGGGTGIASLHFLYRKMLQAGIKDIIFGVGFATKKLHVTLVEQNVGERLRIYTDDGSLGEKGFVTDLLMKCKGKVPLNKIAVFACGPHAMIAALPDKLNGIKREHVQVSLEERMACGLGACLGCMVETVSTQKTVCKDGPVFRLDELRIT